MRYALLRWALFLFVGIPVQFIVYMLYPFVVLYYQWKVKPKLSFEDIRVNPKGSLLDIVEKAKHDALRDTYYINDMDAHTGIIHTHWAVHHKHLAEKGLEQMVTEDGSLRRRIPDDLGFNPVSGDCLSSWMHYYIQAGVNRPDLVNKVALHYLKNCMGLRHHNGQVSARNSNGGVNHAFDGAKQVNQPCFGPQYYTSAATFAVAVAANKGFKRALWATVYWLHYFIMGGWLWKYQPIVHTESNLLYYAHHVTCYNLYTITKCMKTNQSDIIKRIMDITGPNNVNPFFYGMYLDSGGKPTERDWNLVKAMLCSFPGAHGFKAQTIPRGLGYFEEQSQFWSALAIPALSLLNNKYK